MVLLCGDDTSRQAEAVEALIHAVEEERLPVRRIENALANVRRTKERFLAPRASWRPPPEAVLRDVLGRAEHQRIAEDMEQYA